LRQDREMNAKAGMAGSRVGLGAPGKGMRVACADRLR
jgi:hypothetical protein